MKTPAAFRWSLVLGVALGFLSLVALAKAAVAPVWLAEVARTPPTMEWGDASAVVLFEESIVEYDRDARRTTRTRYVVKILKEEGRRRAAGVVHYYASGAKVTLFQAWLIKPGGAVVEYGKKKIIDVTITDDAPALYTDQRKQVLSAVDEATVGAVFGYESVVTTQTVFNQQQWVFQDSVPTELHRLIVKLPPGWTLRAHLRNRPTPVAEVANNVYTWTCRSLPAWPDEAMSIAPQRLAPSVQIDFVPPAGLPPERAGIRVGSWGELARHFTPIYDRAAQPGGTLRARAAQLTANTATTLERTKALASFVQKLNYVSIQLDSENGGGFAPRPAERVLQAGYGDCKDKATLLRALLASVGVDSYPLIVASGQAGQIDVEWPSPLQFNHCILAIRVDDGVDSSAVVTHPELGRLLVFDPTDGSTPFGELDTGLAAQGLLLAGEKGGLVELPEGGNATTRLVRTVEAELSATGDLRAAIAERFAGPGAATTRREFRGGSPGDYRRLVERSLAVSLPALRDVVVEPVDRFDAGEFELAMRFTSLGYGKLMRDELLVFKPVLVARRGVSRLPKRTRVLPIAVRASSYEERSVFILPAGFELDEKPSAVALETAFGRYRAECRVEEGRVVFERALNVRATEIPVSDYESVRAFFDKIHQTEQTPVVLRRVRAAPPATTASASPSGL